MKNKTGCLPVYIIIREAAKKITEKSKNICAGGIQLSVIPEFLIVYVNNK
ncbi:MAG: hypothetical protein QM668_08870 [Agriterribacter sp.]